MKNKKVTQYLILTLWGMVMAACTSTEPIDYSKMRVNRMDLSGAVSLALVKDNTTRAIDGTFLSAGLYKVDANGNITAVAVFFSVDEDGKNYTEHEHALNVRPDNLYDITDNFCIAAGCKYFDEENDYVYVPYQYLLIRKSDGRIWSIDKQIDNYYQTGIISFKDETSFSLKKRFCQSSNGTLYYARREVYKFNLDTNEPSLEQITKNGSIWKNLHLTEQGVIWTFEEYYNSFLNPSLNSIMIYWPYSGFQTIDSEELFEMEFGELSYNTLDYGFEKIKRIYINHLYNIFIDIKEKPLIIFNPSIYYYEDGGWDQVDQEEKDKFQIFCKEYIKPVRADFFEIGNNPGDVKLEGNPIILQDFPKEFIETTKYQEYKGYKISEVYPSKNKILVADNSDNTWLTLIDLDKREWRWLRQLDYKFGYGVKINYEGQYVPGINSIEYNSIDYNNKIWVIDDHVDHFGCYWIDLETFEDGFVPFDFVMPDFFINSYYNTYDVFGFTYDEKGNLKREWINPNDGNNYYLTIDLLSGHGEITMEEPDMYFDTLVPLN